MELYQQIVMNALERGELHLCVEPDSQNYVEMKCFQAMKQIKAIIDDDSLSDPECFMKIEEIVCVLETLGTNGGSRHDFG